MGKFEINGHTHIFNFASVFTENSLKILLDRMKAELLPGFKGEVQDVLVRKMRDLLMPVVKGAAREIDPRTHLMRWLGDLEVDRAVNQVLTEHWGEGLAQLKFINHKGLTAVAVNYLVDLMKMIWTEGTRDDDASQVTLSDLIGFLYTGLQPSIADVTAILLEQSPPDSGIVALTMDVGGDGEKDRAVIARQIRDTSAQVLYHPGRVFPFVAVDPRRKGSLQNMVTAVEQQGFVGVKLYPSLGFHISDPQTNPPTPNPKIVEVCRYCLEKDLPIMVHCSKGGFYRKEEDIARGYPPLWEPLLDQFPGIKVCFAHFGGGEELLVRPMRDDPEAPPLERNWAMAILDLMTRHPGVYTDISSNYDPMVAEDDVEAENYIANLVSFLQDPRYQGRIMFGTDFLLVRRVVRNDNFRAYFLDRLKQERGLFDLMAVANPAGYLGLPDRNGHMGQNIARYRDFVTEKHYKCRSEPAPWLMAAISATGAPLPVFNYTEYGGRWTTNNQAHLWLYKLLCAKREIPDCQGLTRFPEVGGMLLSDLAFHAGWHLPDDQMEVKAIQKAEYIDLQFTAQRDDGDFATYEPGYNSDKAVRQIAGLLNKHGAKIVDLAGLVDMIYRFPAEMED